MLPLTFAMKFQEARRLTETVREADRLVDQAIALYEGECCTDRAALMDALRKLEVVAHRYAKPICMKAPSTGISASAIRMQLDRMRGGVDAVIMQLHALTVASERGDGTLDLEQEATRVVQAEMTGIAILLNDSLGSPDRTIEPGTI